MAATTNTENLRKHKSRFSLAVEQILPFTSNPKMVREVKYQSPNFKKKCVTKFYVIEYSHSDG